MFVFEVGEGKERKVYLHSGDMRYHPRLYASLLPYRHLDALYLDTTYCNPS